MPSLIGNKPNQVPTNGDLGTMAYQDASLYQTRSELQGFRNRIINGGMDVWQRSVGPVTGGSYTTADRWLFAASGITSQQVANDRDTSIPYALQVTADGSGYGILVQRVEDVRTLSNRQATVSFWAKSPSTGTFRFFIEQNFGSGGSATVIIFDNATQFNITSVDTWQFFTVTVTMPSISGKTIGSSSYVNFGIGTNSGITNRVMTYSEIQLEAGSVATPFERRPYGQELALCQRYYYTLVKGNGINFAACNYWNTSEIDACISFKVPMRTAPTLYQVTGTNYFNIDKFGNDTFDSFTGIVSANENCGMLYTTSGVSGVNGFSAQIQTYNANAVIAFQAEL